MNEEEIAVAAEAIAAAIFTTVDGIGPVSSVLLCDDRGSVGGLNLSDVKEIVAKHLRGEIPSPERLNAMHELTKSAIHKLDLMVSADFLPEFTDDAIEVKSELMRLNSLVEAAPKWMDRPSGPGLWICEVMISASHTLFNLVELHEGFTTADLRAVGNVLRLYGPISPKGTPDAS